MEKVNLGRKLELIQTETGEKQIKSEKEFSLIKLLVVGEIKQLKHETEIGKGRQLFDVLLQKMDTSKTFGHVLSYFSAQTVFLRSFYYIHLILNISHLHTNSYKQQHIYMLQGKGIKELWLRPIWSRDQTVAQPPPPQHETLKQISFIRRTRHRSLSRLK